MSRLLAVGVRLRALLAKEFRELLRDPRMQFYVLIPPLVQLLVFGYAATFDVRHAEVAVVDPVQSSHTRGLVQAVTADGRYRARYLSDMAAASRAIDRGTVRAVVRFPHDFERRPRVQVVADGSDSNSAQLILGQVERHLLEHEAARQGEPLRTAVEERAWFNANLDDRIYFVPGIIANVVLIATMVLAAVTVVRERELGTLERLLVTPIARGELLLGKMIPVACVGLFDVLFISAVGVGWFEVPFRGQWSVLVLGASLYLLSSLGLGLLISSYARTQQQAVLLSFFLIMPLIILSGFAFPIENMPEPVQYITYLNPVRYFLVVIRDIFLKGSGLATHLYEFGMMALLGLLALGLSALRVR